MSDAGLNRIDGVYVGNMLSGCLQRQENLGTMMANAIGLTGVSVAKVESACASGGVALHVGVNAIASGANDLVMVAGVEKMTSQPNPNVTAGLMGAEDQMTVAGSGISFVGLNAMIAQAYMDKFSVPPEKIARFPVVCHKHALNSPHAQFKKSVTVDDVLNSPMVADPIRLYECSGIGDGAAAVILASEEKAREITDSPILVAASAVANDTQSLHQRSDMTTFDASVTSSRKAYERAKVSAEDIDVLEVHDAFSILGVMALEDLGFVEKGKGTTLLEDGQIEVGGMIPTNTFGGLKARGHPVGATGVYQIVEVAKQLRGEAGRNQVAGAETGYAQNIGGIGSTITGHILARMD
jgi:acetyl-CoA C-acetyltransferase